METAEQVVSNAKKVMEQQVGKQIVDNIGGTGALKGLRSGGTSRSFRLTGAYSSPDGKYPVGGSYRYRHVRTTDSRGRPRDVTHYIIRVYGDGSVPPTIAIQRMSVKDVQT